MTSLVKFLIVAFIIGLIIILTLLIIFGISYRPSFKQIFVDPNSHRINPICQKEKIICNSEEDCKKCSDNVEMTCVTLNRSEDQEKQYGKEQKYCLPKIPDQPCNTKNGGIWTWTGWANTNRMEWDCLCTYPEIAGGNGCEQLNPNVCQGGQWDYDAKTASIAPTYKNCKCGAGTQLIETRPNGVPICVPATPYLCQSEQNCNTMYSNSTFIK